jgi:hypothetical protein
MGKSSLIYVVGLGILIAIAILNINRTSTDSIENYSKYYGRTIAHNLSTTGANVATEALMRNPNLAAGTLYANQTLGTDNADFTVALLKPPSVPARTARIESYARFRLPFPSWQYPDAYYRDTSVATFRFAPFSMYGWWTQQENNGYVSATGTNGPYYGSSDWKITGDSVFGLAHTNGHFNLGGRPYFNDRVTATNAPTLMTVNGQKAPIYNGGYNWGVTVNRDVANITDLKTQATTGNVLSLPFNNNDVGLEFYNSGNVRVRIPWNTGGTTDTTVRLSDITSTGVIGVQSGDLHIKGTYKGDVTVAAFKGTSGASTNKGNVWIDGNVVGNTSPRTNDNSPDMLGIVAERMAYISQDNTRNANSVLNIDAAIYCQTGELTAENFWNLGTSNTPKGHGRVSLFGGVTQNSAGSLGVFGSSGLTSGFFYSIRWDSRFGANAPPFFPSTANYVLVSWWEN